MAVPYYQITNAQGQRVEYVRSSNIEKVESLIVNCLGGQNIILGLVEQTQQVLLSLLC